ncbi:MAG: hypothetical protein ABW195_14800 [Ilumatobacteraceae bacterium]
MTRSPRSGVAPLAAAIAVLLTVTLAACGGDDDDADSTTATGVTSTADTADDTAVTVAGSADTAVIVTVGTDVDTSSATGGGEVGTEDEYVEAAAAAIPWEDEEMSECAAVAIIDAIGYEQIQEVGVSVEQFGDVGPLESGLTIDEDSVSAVSSDVAACGDVLEQLTFGLGDEERSCVGANLDNEQLAESIVAPLFGLDPSADVAAGEDAIDECLREATTTSLAS